MNAAFPRVSGALNVAAAQAKIVRAPLRSPFRIATGQHDFLENVFLGIELADGTRGFGEAGVASHISGETVEQTLANLQSISARLVGVDIHDYRSCCESFRNDLRGNPAALAAAEMAVLDVISRHLGFPFWRWFGSHSRPLRTDITVVLGSVKEAGRAARRFWQRGFRAFKIKIGGDAELDRQRVAQVARTAPGARILLDGNQGYSAERMLEFLKALTRQGIRPALLEQPVPRGDWEGLSRLAREARVPVCADESVRTLGDAVFAAKQKAVQVINIKFAKSGILEAAEIARFCRAAGLRLMIGAMMESALSISASAHFASGMRGFEFVDLDTTYFIQGRLSRCPFLGRDGTIDVTGSGPGIGVDLKRD